MSKEFPFSTYAVRMVAGANMASVEEIQEEIRSIEELIGTGYYDDLDGDLLLQQIVVYLKKKAMRI